MTARTPAVALIGGLLFLGASPVAAAETAEVGAFDNYFKPRKAKINVDDKVRWINREGTHSVVIKSGGQDLNSVISGDATVTSKKFREPGTYRFVCRFHEEEGMKGRVVVSDPDEG